MRLGLALALVCLPSALACEPEPAALGQAPLFIGCTVPPITTGVADGCGAGLGAVVPLYPSPLEDRLESCRARFATASADTASALCPRGFVTSVKIGDTLLVLEGQTNDDNQGVFVHEFARSDGSAATYTRTRFVPSQLGAGLFTMAAPEVARRPLLLEGDRATARFVDAHGVTAFDGSTFARTQSFALPLLTRITAFDDVGIDGGTSMVLGTSGSWAAVERFDGDGTRRFAWRFETTVENVFVVHAVDTNEAGDVAFIGRFARSTWLVVLSRDGHERTRRRIPTMANVALRYEDTEVFVVGTTRLSRTGSDRDLEEHAGALRDFAMRFSEGTGCPTQLHEMALGDVSLTDTRRAIVTLRDGSRAQGHHPGTFEGLATLVTTDRDGRVCDAAELSTDDAGFDPIARIVELSDTSLVTTDGTHVWHVLRE